MTATVDLAHGGRWTSLRAGDREWLWHRPAPRSSVVPDADFVDAGGLEECIPTVRGKPDHGSAWSRPWRLASGLATVDLPDFSLSRRLSCGAGAVVADYRVEARPGWRFVWAAHALLELSDEARIIAPIGTRTRVYTGVTGWETGPWPAPLGSRLDTCGPLDGSATGAILVSCPEVGVVDGDALTFALEVDGQPASVALWRNLGGFPDGDPYRSIGVEPMLGRVFDLAEAARPGDAATVPASGILEWRLTITGGRGRMP